MPIISLILLVTLSGCGDTTAKKPYGQPTDMVIDAQTKVNYLTVHYFALRTCMMCHQDRLGPFFPTYETLKANIGKVSDAIVGDDMPPVGARFNALTACQKLVLSHWIADGLPIEGGTTLGASGNACY
jgi:hypothetical protein